MMNHLVILTIVVAVLSLITAYGFHKSSKLIRELRAQCASMQNAIDCLGYDVVDDYEEPPKQKHVAVEKLVAAERPKPQETTVVEMLPSASAINSMQHVDRCIEIIKSGKKKGEPCGRLCEGDKCNLHNKPIKENSETKQAVVLAEPSV